MALPNRFEFELKVGAGTTVYSMYYCYQFTHFKHCITSYAHKQKSFLLGRLSSYAILSLDANMQLGYQRLRCRIEESSLPPLLPLPSPLCCPRRTFLPCLILVLKLMQDRSYSNRAWAKLAGLPPREIECCERTACCADKKQDAMAIKAV